MLAKLNYIIGIIQLSLLSTLVMLAKLNYITEDINTEHVRS